MSQGSNGVIPYILSSDCEKHSQWLIEVLDAKVTSKHLTKSEKYIMHMSFSVNEGEIYMADEASGEECDVNNMVKIDESKGVKRGMHVYVSRKDVDSTWQKAMQKGATEHVQLEDKIWGERWGIFRDPWGYLWTVSTPLKKPSEPNENLKIVKVHKDAKVPEKPFPGQVGYSLCAADNVTIAGNSTKQVDTGLSLQLPINTFGKIISGTNIQEELYIKTTILNQEKSDDKESLQVCIRNLSPKQQHIKSGQEIARLILEKNMTPDVEVEN
eukprot:TRINITY_DN4593_c0_g1_i4.p2 TRINITY_DN4593_c0_g1~~TRINITY_DN4593_c0_g1_i4.p2  ORF type:complete len:270 (-),score=24.21 TRINITY_DN4593_c0_g1_i4:320-1129(-)